MNGETQASISPSVTARVSPMCPVRSVTCVTGHTNPSITLPHSYTLCITPRQGSQA